MDKQGDELPEEAAEEGKDVWGGSARPKPNWKRKPPRPRPANGKSRLRWLNRTPLSQKPAGMSRPASRRQAVPVAPADRRCPEAVHAEGRWESHQ